MATIEKPTAAPLADPYGPEVLCASWNPVAASLGKSVREVCPEWVAEADADTFLPQFYRAQQI